MGDKGDELQRSKEQAEAALEKAERVLRRSKGLGERWRDSRADNNFRLMIRKLATRGE